MGKRTHARPVFPLVQEEARFLAFGPVYDEFVAVFEDCDFIGIIPGGLVKITVNEVESRLERRGAGALVVHCLEALSVHFLQGFADGAFSPEHAHGVSLEDTYAVIPVYDKAGKTVSFTMHEAVAGCLLRAVQSECLAGLQSP